MFWAFSGCMALAYSSLPCLVLRGTDSSLHHGLDISWATIPTNLLLAELARRNEQDGGHDETRPQCGSGSRGSYDTAVHVGALVLILVLSTVCTYSPQAVAVKQGSPLAQISS